MIISEDENKTIKGEKMLKMAGLMLFLTLASNADNDETCKYKTRYCSMLKAIVDSERAQVETYNSKNERVLSQL